MFSITRRLVVAAWHRQRQPPQEDVIFIPALDPGKSFEFVAVNQTNRCAWLLAPTTITIRVAGDEVTS